ncbi:MAG TPA: RidA family protein [Chloroflexota bacterium]|nr:RidA family protein [Chloroflexota bacterium]
MNEIVNPRGMAQPVGFAYAVKCRGTLLFLAGATGQDASGNIHAPGDLVAQFEAALANICQVVKAAGGMPEDIVKLTYYVRDRDAYVAHRQPIGEVYRRYFGKHYPAQSLFGVTALWEEDALIEIEAIACIDDSGGLRPLGPPPEVSGNPLPQDTTVPGT